MFCLQALCNQHSNGTQFAMLKGKLRRQLPRQSDFDSIQVDFTMYAVDFQTAVFPLYFETVVSCFKFLNKLMHSKQIKRYLRTFLKTLLRLFTNSFKTLGRDGTLSVNLGVSRNSPDNSNS